MPAPIEQTSSRDTRRRAQQVMDKLPNPLFLADPAFAGVHQLVGLEAEAADLANGADLAAARSELTVSSGGGDGSAAIADCSEQESERSEDSLSSSCVGREGREEL